MPAVQPNSRAIIELRHSKLMSQEALAMKSGYSKRTIERIETGAKTRLTTLADIAEVLGTTVGALTARAGPDAVEGEDTNRDEVQSPTVEVVISREFETLTQDERREIVERIVNLLGNVDSVRIRRG